MVKILISGINKLLEISCPRTHGVGLVCGWPETLDVPINNISSPVLGHQGGVGV
jgi:hypothetical protein